MSTSDQQDPISNPCSEEAPPLTGMPRWVKGLLVAALAAVLLFVVAMLLLGGEHGPGRHMSALPPDVGGATQTLTTVEGNLSTW